MSTLLTFEAASLPADWGYELPTLVLIEVSAVKEVVATIGVGVEGVGDGVGVGVGVGLGVGVGVDGVIVPELDPFAEVVVAPDEARLLEAAPPQPVTSANPSRAHARVPNREI